MLYVDADWTKFGFHLHICRKHQIAALFQLWCLWHQDMGVKFGKARDWMVRLP